MTLDIKKIKKQWGKTTGKKTKNKDKKKDKDKKSSFFSNLSGEEDDKTDYYGFTSDYQYDRTVDYKTVTPKRDLYKYISVILIVFVLIVVLFMLLVTAWLAWNSFTFDPIWLKIMKTFIAILFVPVFLFYIFIKTVIFKLPN